MSEQMLKFDTLQGENLKQLRTDPVGLYLKQLDNIQKFKDISLLAVDLSFMSKEQRAEALWALFQEVKREASGRSVYKRKEKIKQVDPNSKEKEIKEEVNDKPDHRTREEEEIEWEKFERERAIKSEETIERVASGFAKNIGLLKALYADDEVRATYIEASKRNLQEIEAINGDWEKYEILQNQIQEAEAAVDVMAKKIFSSRGGSLSESNSILSEVNRRCLARTRQELAVIVGENPELAAYAQYDNLRGYARELAKGGFMWLSSRRKALEEIEKAALGGKPVLLSGESGTGKTVLVGKVAMTLTGRPVNQTPGKDVRFQELIAKLNIGTNDGTSTSTYYRYGAIGQAVTGMVTTLDKQPRHAGGIIADDEFNLLPAAEQTERLARIADWTPGKLIKMPVTEEEIVVAANFLYIAMVNLASERYSRTKIPSEVLRKFSMVELDYLTQTDEEPELYEAMLAALMDENGRLRAAVDEVIPQFEDREEIETAVNFGQEVKRTVRIRELQNRIVDEGGRTVPAGGFLWRLAEAINEINKSFSHHETVLKAKGEGQFVKDLIIDIGSLTSWLKEYRTIGYSQNLEVFIIDKLNTEFLSKQAYSAEDRSLATDFLKYFGIDISQAGLEQAAAKKYQFENLTPVEIGKLSPRVRCKEIVDEEPILMESYLINSEGKRVDYKIESYRENEMELIPSQVIKKKIDGEFVQYLGLIKKTGEPIFVPYRVKPEELSKRQEEHRGVSFKEAAEIMGDDFLGPDAVENALGVKLNDIPPIEFSRAELKRARESGLMLILRVSQAPDGEALSMAKLKSLLKERFTRENKGKILSKGSVLKNKSFFTNKVPETRWALVSKEIIPDSMRKNYLEQTETIATYIKDSVFKDMTIPPEFADAIDEFEKQKADIASIIDTDREEAARRLSKLKLNKLTRQTPIEALYDIIVRLLVKGDRLLEKTYTWTGGRDSYGEFVCVGDAGAGGAVVGAFKPSERYNNLGVVFSRSLGSLKS